MILKIAYLEDDHWRHAAEHLLLVGRRLKDAEGRFLGLDVETSDEQMRQIVLGIVSALYGVEIRIGPARRT